MKTIKHLMIAAMVLFAGNAMAQKLSAEAVSIAVGGEASLMISYESEQELTGAQFSVALPAGVELKEENYEYISTLGADQTGYQENINDGDGCQIVIISRVSKKAPALVSGKELITLTLVANADAEVGEAKAKIYDIVFSQYGESVRGNADFNVTINVFTKSEAIIVVGGEAYITGTFGQELAAPTVTVTEGYDGILSYKSSNEEVVKVAADGQLTVVGAGEAVITISGTETDNWKAPANVTYNVQIDKASITPGITLEGWTFGQAANMPAVTGNIGNGTVSYQYKAKEADDNAYNTQVPVNSGNYTVKAVVEATANYKGGEATADFTIARKSVTEVMIEDIADQSYTGSALTPEITVKDGNTTMVLNIDYTVAYTDNTEVGRATVTITGQGNYKDSASKTFFIIVKGDTNGDGDVNVADIDVVIEAIGEEYDEKADSNGDGEVNVADADFIIERIGGTEE